MLEEQEVPERDRALLERLVEIIDAASAPEGFDVRPTMLRIVLTDEGIEYGQRDLDGQHVGEALLGFTAPEDWWAVGVMTGGWTRGADDLDSEEARRGRTGHPPAVSDPNALRVRSVILASREGDLAGRTRIADGTVIDDAPTEGFIPDTLRRTLGLPTTPPEVPSCELLTSIWLGEVATMGDRKLRREGRRLTWASAARLHPALELLKASGERVRPDALVPAANALARVATWSEIHRLASGRRWLSGMVDAELAAWMDEGMLARWLLARYPSIPTLVDDATKVVTPAAVETLRATALVLSTPSCQPVSSRKRA